MKKIIWTIIIIMVVIGGYSVIGKKPGNDIVKIGVIAGTTGEYASAGEGYVKGFNLALEQWNNSNDLKFLPIIEDDSFNAVKGLSAYKKISSTNDVGAYAILSSFTIDAVYDLIKNENKPVALGFEQSKLAENDNIFQVLPAGRPIQVALGKELKRLGYSKPVVVVSNNTPVYQNFHSGFVEGFGDGSVKYDLGGDITSIRSQALNIIKTKPDAIVFFAIPKDGAILIKEILKVSSGNLPKFAFDQSFQSGITDYKNILGGDMNKIDGSIISMSKNDYTEEFKNSFKIKYGIEAPFGSDMGYNSFYILASTYDVKSASWIDNLKKAVLIGADGEIKFDDVGLRNPNVFFGELKNGEVVN